MPITHQDKYKENKEIVEKGVLHEYAPWEVTVCFYAALHMVNIILKQKGISVGNHQERNESVRLHLNNIYKEYMRLYALSQHARYFCMPISNRAVAESKKMLRKIELILGAPAFGINDNRP